MTIDSGTPSRTLPSTIASAEPLAWPPSASLRWLPPIRSMSQSPPKKTPQPAETPAMTQPWPDDLSTASSMRSNETALISTPAPKAMISPIARKRIWNTSATIAPITSEDAARVPQPKAAAIGLRLLVCLRDLDRDGQRVDDRARRGHDPGGADDRGDRGEDAADLVGVDTGVGGRLEVQQIRGRRGIDRDERSEADEHERLRIETRRDNRVRGHAGEQVEDGGLVRGCRHRASFPSGMCFRTRRRPVGVG